jgi:hypothetical protein
MVGRVQLAQRLAVARAQPTPVAWSVLAEREGVSISQAHRILAAYRAEGLQLGDPLGLVRETLGIFNRAIEQLGEIAEAENSHSTVKVGALRLLLEALGARIQLLTAAGLMPKRLSAQRDHEDAVALVRRMAEVIERHDLGDRIVDELIAVVEGTARELGTARA